MSALTLAGATLLLVASTSAAWATTLTLERVLARPFAPVVDIVPVPGSDDRAFMVNLVTGGVDIYDASEGTMTPFLTSIEIDGTPLASTPFAASAYSVAPAPDFETSGRFYVSVNTADKRNVVVEYTATASNVAGDAPVDPITQRRIITIAHPPGGGFETHYGGALRFGPDGYLYLTTGDTDWPIDQPETNPAQDVTNRLGAVLRIDPTSDDFITDTENNYAIPDGNPDFGPGADPALYAIGARNPFKIAFDPVSGALIVADVGEVQGDEISAILPGPGGVPNLGWPAFEGSNPLSPSILPLVGDVIDPLLDVLQGNGPFEGFSLTGGTFYSGPIAALDGRYIFADFGPGTDPDFVSPIWSVLLDPINGTFSDLQRWEAGIVGGGSLGGVIGIGLDAGGTLYVSTLDLGTLVGDVYAVRGIAPVPVLPALGSLLSGLCVLLVTARRRSAS